MGYSISMITHGELAEAARNWLHIPIYRVALKEIGLPDGKRIDVLGYTLKDGVIRLVECKASLRDLKKIPTQLEKYRRFADLLYVAVPENLEKEAKELLPKKVGLLVVYEHTQGRRYLSIRPTRNPRTVEVVPRVRTAIRKRVLTWLTAHFERTIVCKNCTYTLPHGPS